MKGGSMQSEACRWRWTFREEGGGTRSGGQEWPVEASRRATVLAFSPLPSLSLIVSTNRKVENYYGSKSIRLPRVIGVSCPSRNSFLIYSRLFTSVKNYQLVRSISKSFIEIFRFSKSLQSKRFFFSSFFLFRKFDSNNEKGRRKRTIVSKLFRCLLNSSDHSDCRIEGKKNNFPRVIESSYG